MRKVLVLITLLCLLCGLAAGANAATTVKEMHANAMVSSDSSCRITLAVALHLDKPAEDLRFPLPGSATDITVNGYECDVTVENGLRYVELDRLITMAGDFSLQFAYTLPDLVATDKNGLTKLHLPLLSGFSYPIEEMKFSVTLPGEVSTQPAFSSGYHQANIEKYLQCQRDGATITGVTLTGLKDHETLEMTLTVPPEMFPPPAIAPPDVQTTTIIALVLFLAAVLYWILFLGNMPVLALPRPTPPGGYGAGEIGSVLYLQGGNLHTMVFSWAQMGYLLIRATPQGDVVLYRQMDMGNERSFYEQHCYKLLFGKKNLVNVSGRRYGAAYRAAEKLRPDLSALVQPGFGNLTIFRVLAALTGLFFGLSIAVELSDDISVQWVLMVLLGLAALCSSWHIQRWIMGIVSPQRGKLWLALGLSGFWIGLSIAAGRPLTGLTFALLQFLAGWLFSLAGRRTPAGRQAIADALGLRRYLKTVPKEQLQQICRHNPEYFHQMMPYALALGVDKAFAKGFGSHKVGPCPYIFTGPETPANAMQWRAVMRRILQEMNTRPGKKFSSRRS